MSSSEACSLVIMLGIAILTIVRSSRVMKNPSETTSSTAQGLAWNFRTTSPCRSGADHTSEHMLTSKRRSVKIYRDERRPSGPGASRRARPSEHDYASTCQVSLERSADIPLPAAAAGAPGTTAGAGREGTVGAEMRRPVMHPAPPSPGRGSMLPPMELSGTAAIISGGASGLGEAAARALAAAGSTVVIADLNEERGKAIAAEVGGEFVKTDVSDEASVAAAVAVAAGKGAPLRAVVNCAGIGWAERTV